MANLIDAVVEGCRGAMVSIPVTEFVGYSLLYFVVRHQELADMGHINYFGIGFVKVYLFDAIIIYFVVLVRLYFLLLLMTDIEREQLSLTDIQIITLLF